MTPFRNHAGSRLIALAVSAFFVARLASGEAISFQNQVMPVLSKAGCNAGTCHGNKNGKGGFKLSLRGQDPAMDYLALTHDFSGRRVDPLDSARSLILLKPMTQVAHEGGLRFKQNSPEYQTLAGWIEEGLKNDLAQAPKLEGIVVLPTQKVLIEPEREVQLNVEASFSDGSKRDVTSMAVFDTSNPLAKVSHDGLVQGQGAGESTVLVRFLQCQEPVSLAFVPERPGFEWKAAASFNYIDEQVFAKLRTLRMNASELCSDEIFLRRAYLDLLGLLPTLEEARAFLHQSDSTGNIAARRARLVDQLLERPEFADFWALKWADLLRVEGHSLDQKGVLRFHGWIRESIAANKPLDQFVRELITARGSTYASPAANYYRPHRDPVARGKAAAQVFLGTRLQCAECHNHPSDRWTQDDYYDWASLFAGIQYKVIENNREIESDEHEWKGEQVIFVSRQSSLTNPRTGSKAQPRFLGVSEPAPAVGPDSLTSLADWLTSPRNTLFTRVQANRIWSQLMGRGLVDPPDDFRATNPASHPELLQALAADFAEHHFDTRYLIRLIMNSRAYQLSSDPNASNAGDQINYSHALVRRLGAEQTLDCQSEVAGVPLKFSDHPAGSRAAQLPGVRPESKGKRRASQLDQFLETFGKPPRLLTTDTERSCECNMTQAFQMLSGPTVNDMLGEKENRVARLLAEKRSNSEILDELFWAALTRSATRQELDQLLPELEKAPDRRAELEDVLWGLLNSKDFLFRR